MVYQRDQAIKNFKPEPYFELNAEIVANQQKFVAKLDSYQRFKDETGLMIFMLAKHVQNDDYLSSLETTAFLETQIKPEVKTTLRSLQLFGPAPTTHQGAYQGHIALYASTSSGTGQTGTHLQLIPPSRPG